MSYLLDTSVLIELRDGAQGFTDRVRSLTLRPLMSVVSRVELEGGIATGTEADQAARRQRLALLLEKTPALPFGDDEAEAYGRIVAVLRYSRRKLLDRMIAAQALVAGATLVTLNGDDFRDVPGLTLLEL